MLTENQMLLRKTRHPKPHLYLRSGYWRVSLMPKPYWRYKTDFASAHLWANYQNQLRISRNDPLPTR